MGKNCVQAVRTSGKKAVEELPHYPHLCVQSTYEQAPMCTKTPTFASFVPTEPTAKYTGFLRRLTGMAAGLSPVSTVPTITTTTYIYKKEEQRNSL